MFRSHNDLLEITRFERVQNVHRIFHANQRQTCICPVHYLETGILRNTISVDTSTPFKWKLGHLFPLILLLDLILSLAISRGVQINFKLDVRSYGVLFQLVHLGFGIQIYVMGLDALFWVLMRYLTLGWDQTFAGSGVPPWVLLSTDMGADPHRILEQRASELDTLQPFHRQALSILALVAIVVGIELAASFAVQTIESLMVVVEMWFNLFVHCFFISLFVGVAEAAVISEWDHPITLEKSKRGNAVIFRHKLDMVSLSAYVFVWLQSLRGLPIQDMPGVDDAAGLDSSLIQTLRALTGQLTRRTNQRSSLLPRLDYLDA